MNINSDVFGDVGPVDPEESILAMLHGRPIVRARMPGRGPEAEIPPFIPERRTPLAFPATRPAARVPALGSAPAYGPLTQEESASPEAGTLQRLRYEYEHPVTPLQPHGLKAFGEGLLSLLAPRVENFIQQRRFAPAYAQQNRITGLERDAQLLTPQQQPLQDVTKAYSDALARGDTAAAERLKPGVQQFRQATERPATPGQTHYQTDAKGDLYAITTGPDGKPVSQLVQGGFAKPEDKTGAVAPELEAQFGAKPTTNTYGGRTYPSVAAAQRAWGKDVETEKTNEAGAAAYQRGQGFATWSLQQKIDPATGKMSTVLINGRTGEMKDAPAGVVTSHGGGAMVKAQQDYQGAVARANLMRETLAKIQADPKMGAQGDVLLLANHIGMTLGLQKGARITRDVWNEAKEQRPWMQGIQVRFEHGVLTGASLSPQQREQMVMLADEQVSVQRRLLTGLGASLTGGTNAAAQAPTGQRDLGAAPAGKKNGDTGTLPDGTRVTVQNGRLVAQ